MTATDLAPFDRPTPWAADLDLGAVTITDELSPDLADPVTEVVSRFGFALIRSSPCALDGDSIGRRRAVLRAFGASLGTPVVQSPRRELVEDVKDFSDVEQDDDRGYRSGGELSPHSDPPTLLVLHCVRPARAGGETSIVSVPAVVGRLRRRAPDVLAELFGEFATWHVAGQHGRAVAGPGDDRRPILAAHHGVLSCVLYRPFTELAADATGTPLTERQTAALDAFDRWSTSPDLTVRFVARPGETVVLHNRAVLHARTDFTDWPEQERRRHLLRMWIDSPGRFPVHPAHELGGLFADRPMSPRTSARRQDVSARRSPFRRRQM